MKANYRLERWIVVVLLGFFALPFVGTAEEFYASRWERRRADTRDERTAPPHAGGGKVSLPEDGVPNAIDSEPAEERPAVAPSQ